jgi:hypothetical protein
VYWEKWAVIPSEKSIREDLAVGAYVRDFGNLSGMARDRQNFEDFQN